MTKKIVPSVGIVAIKDDGILLVREGDKSGHITGMYGLPSGRVNDDESAQEAAAREFHEETGLNAKTVGFREFKNNYFNAEIPRKDGTITNFGWRVFKVNNFYGELKSSDETQPEWLGIERIEGLARENKLLPNVLNAINAALK